MDSPEETTALTQISATEHALEEAQTPAEATRVRRMFEAIRVCAKEAGAGLEAQNQAAEGKIYAERKVGSLLEDVEKMPAGVRD